MCICRLTLAWISNENSTTHEECWLILTALPSLTLEPYLMPTGLSAVRCRLVTRVTLRQLPSSQSLCLTLWLAFPSYFRSRRDLKSKPFVWFRAKTDRGIICLADHLHSVTAICIVLLHFSNFCFSLSSVADFSNTEARAPTSTGRSLFLPIRRAIRFGQVVWVWVMVIFRWLCFILIYRSHPNRWAVGVPRSNYLILIVVP